MISSSNVSSNESHPAILKINRKKNKKVIFFKISTPGVLKYLHDYNLRLIILLDNLDNLGRANYKDNSYR